MLNKKLLGALALLSCCLVLMAAYNRPYRWWPFNDMSEQPILKPFTENGLLSPAEGSVALDDWEPVPTKFEVANFPEFKNPIAATPESIQTGEKLYNVYCLSCHGPGMTANPEAWTPVQKKGMPGANILLVKTYSDEHIFAVLTHGSGAIMKRVSYHLSPEERWHVVNYVRSVANEN